MYTGNLSYSVLSFWLISNIWCLNLVMTDMITGQVHVPYVLLSDYGDSTCLLSILVIP